MTILRDFEIITDKFHTGLKWSEFLKIGEMDIKYIVKNITSLSNIHGVTECFSLYMKVRSFEMHVIKSICQ